jgi:hypothetical protein
LRPRADGRLPDGYHQACKHLEEAGAELTAAFASGELTAVTFTEEWKEIEVPAEYWEPNSPSDATLANSKIGATSSSPPEWRQYYGRPCFVNEQKFATWLSGGTSPARAAEGPPARRLRDPGQEAEIRSRIQKVHAAAQRLCTKKGGAIELAPLAAALDGTANYKAESIRQILTGTYKPAKARGFAPFEWKRPKR